jgi:hypothetical protein
MGSAAELPLLTAALTLPTATAADCSSGRPPCSSCNMQMQHAAAKCSCASLHLQLNHYGCTNAPTTEGGTMQSRLLYFNHLFLFLFFLFLTVNETFSFQKKH